MTPMLEAWITGKSKDFQQVGKQQIVIINQVRPSPKLKPIQLGSDQYRFDLMSKCFQRPIPIYVGQVQVKSQEFSRNI